MGRGGQDIGKRPDKIARETAPLPEEPIGSQRTTTGIIKWWDARRGYGAIATEETGIWDIWCHFSHVQGVGFKALTPGERVAVDFIRADQESFKYVAWCVRRLEAPGETTREAD